MGDAKKEMDRHAAAKNYMTAKTKSLILAYQKLYALSRLNAPLAPGALNVVLTAQPFSMEWLSSASVTACLFDMTFHGRYLLVCLQHMVLVFLPPLLAFCFMSASR